jgi:hypothetical protein
VPDERRQKPFTALHPDCHHLETSEPDAETPECLGRVGDTRSEPLAITQLLLLLHLVEAAR